MQVPYRGKVLDGRLRLRACEELGVGPRFEGLPDDTDPVAYVVSHNVARRHMTPSQLGMCGARAREEIDRLAKERMQAGKGADGGGGRGHKKNPPARLPEGLKAGDARDQAAALVGVSGRTIDFAAKVLKDSVPDYTDVG
jgi:hypothetical protein